MKLIRTEISRLGLSNAGSWGLLLSLGAVLLVCHARTDFTGLTGPYCATRYRERVCCTGRQDDCSVPILGTLCYCDDFCKNRTRDEDCCPDYDSFCRGIEEPAHNENRGDDPLAYSGLVSKTDKEQLR
jgi:hypothetical protein